METDINGIRVIRNGHLAPGTMMVSDDIFEQLKKHTVEIVQTAAAPAEQKEGTNDGNSKN